MPNLAEQIREALSMFARNGTQPALIDGLAVVAHQVVRATKDVDFLLEAEAADQVHGALLDLGYQCLYRSEDAANYVRAAEGLDLLYAHRPLARRLLAQASERETPMGRMRIISVEGLNEHPTWSSWLNQPTAQIYRVAADHAFPYWVTGAQQDSGAVRVRSRGRFAGITMRDWEPLCAGGESGADCKSDGDDGGSRREAQLSRQKVDRDGSRRDGDRVERAADARRGLPRAPGQCLRRRKGSRRSRSRARPRATTRRQARRIPARRVR